MPAVRALMCAGALSLAATACSLSATEAPDASTCRTLEYGKGGPSRSAYMPCAGEIMAALKQLDRLTTAALDGDTARRTEGQAMLRRVIALMKSAGGRELLERWQDRALTDLNVDIHNAVTHYSAFYMLPIKQEPHPFAAKTREAATAEMLGARRNYLSAQRNYQRAGGR